MLEVFCISVAFCGPLKVEKVGKKDNLRWRYEKVRQNFNVGGFGSITFPSLSKSKPLKVHNSSKHCS